jgi:hypothetical protein
VRSSTGLSNPTKMSKPLVGAHRVLLWLGLIAAVLGALEPSSTLLAVAAACVGIAIVVRDVTRLNRGALTPITFFALAFALSSLANTFGVQSLAERGTQSPFDLYVAMDYVYFSCAIMLVGGTAIIVGFYTAQHWRTWRMAGKALPNIRARVNDRDLMYGGVGIAVLSILVTNAVGPNRFGTLSGLVALLPDLTVFTLSRLGAARRSHRITMVALGLALVVAVQAALFAYLRSEILLPIFALLIGLIVGSRSLAVLRRRVLIPAYLLIALFAVNFATLGRIRSTAGAGESRVEALRAASATNAPDSTGDEGGIMVRLSTVNQLSQIGWLVSQRGFLHGSTLEYLGFAFVPRFLWPGKPKIAKGAWFAYQIGQAILRPDGTYGNSINMTVPGELYLNFGWGGVVVGSYLFGALLALLWSTTLFWTDGNNPLGTAFGFYLLWIGIGLVADLQIIVTLIAMYLLFLAGSLVLSGVRRSRKLLPMQIATPEVRATARLRA